MNSCTIPRRRRFRTALLALPIVALLICLFAHSLTAQTNGITLTLSKAHNAPTPVPSGQTFTYTLAYGWSGGVPGSLVISDIVPPELDVLSALPGTPASTIVGNTVTFTLSGLTASAGAGTVQINVRFKPGVTCSGTRACNSATIQVQGDNNSKVTSNSVCATATAANKWTFEKALVAGCAVDNDVIFRICVMNPSGGDVGGLNLTSAQLTDVVPTGAIVTSVSGSWTGFTQLGTNVTLTGGPSTLPVSPWNAWYCVYLHVTFPSPTFQQGNTVINRATLSYKTPCDTIKAQTYTDTAAVTLCAANPSGSLWKGLSINIYFPSNPYYYPSFSPGCCGSYTLSYYNSGNVAQSGVVMEDILPTTLDVTSIKTNVISGTTPVTLDVFCWSAGVCSAAPCTTVVYTTPGFQTLSTLPTNVCKVRWTYGGPLPIATSVQNYLDVCVRTASYASPFTAVTAGQNIINTVTAQATGVPLITATNVKPVDSLKPKILATKFFMGSCGPSCSPLNAGPFIPGNIVRWRMAVSNVGNTNASPCTITDLLPTGLTYVGNPTYFYGTFSWMANQYNPPCCSLATTVPAQIGGTITSPAAGATSLTWTFPTLPYRCDGTVDYLIIEFDVKISDSPPAPPGNYDNTFTFSAGNLTTPVTSNIATLTVNAVAQLTLQKQVRQKPSGTFGPNVTVPAGSQVEFGMRLKNTGNLSLTNICLLDIMPHIGDIMVLPGYSARNSQFDLPLTTGGSVVVPAGYVAGYNTFSNTKNPRRTTACIGFCGVTDPTTGVPPLVNGSFGTFGGTTYSFDVEGNTTTLAPGATLDVFATATVPAGTANGLNACNNIAVKAIPVGTTTCLATQSTTSCVTVGQAPSSPCKELWLEGHADSCCSYHMILSNSLGALATLQYNVLSGGVVTAVQTPPCPPTSTVPTSLANTTTGQLNFNMACTGAAPINLQIDASSTTASGQICIELIATVVRNGVKTECRDTVCFHCKRAPQFRCDSMSVKPFPYPDLDLSGRTFTVYNLKSPTSPICSVKIVVTPPPAGPGVNGGGLYVDGVWKSWPYGTSVAYTQILAVHGLPATNTVQFNLGIDYTIGWVGNVSVTAYHCDGDSCSMTYGPWKATKKDIILIGTPIDIKEKANLRVYRLTFPRDKARGKDIRTIAIRHSSQVTSIVAVTGASFPCDSSGDCDDLFDVLRVKNRTVVIDLRHPLDAGTGATDPAVTVLYTAQDTKNPSLEIVYYDASGQELGHDSTVVTGGALLDEQGGTGGFLGSLEARPNPTSGRCDIGFTLPAVSTVDLDLLDALGNKVATVIRGERIEAGEHHRTIDLTSLANGSYLAALRVNGIPTVIRIEVIR